MDKTKFSRVKCKTKCIVHEHARGVRITISCQTPTGCRSEVITKGSGCIVHMVIPFQYFWLQIIPYRIQDCEGASEHPLS